MSHLLHCSLHLFFSEAILKITRKTLSSFRKFCIPISGAFLLIKISKQTQTSEKVTHRESSIRIYACIWPNTLARMDAKDLYARNACSLFHNSLGQQTHFSLCTQSIKALVHVAVLSSCHVCLVQEPQNTPTGLYLVQQGDSLIIHWHSCHNTQVLSNGCNFFLSGTLPVSALSSKWK